MARKRSKQSVSAEKLYLESKGTILLKDIANKLGVSNGTVRSWKNRYSWEKKLNGNYNATLQKESKKENKKRNVAIKNKENIVTKVDKDAIDQLEDANLTERQRLFCLYYIESFNATRAALKAGYSKGGAHVEGCRLLKKPKIIAQIRNLKKAMQEEIFVEAMDVFKKYIAITFADMTDYLKWGQREADVMGAFGPVKGKDGQTLKKTVNFVDLIDSDTIDGTLIQEVKQGKEGVSIKLMSKEKAMEKLSVYFDLFPDKFKRELEQAKLDLQRQKQGEVDTEFQDDGFMDAIKDSVQSVWDDEDEIEAIQRAPDESGEFDD